MRFRDIKELAEAIKQPPLSLTTDDLWEAYRSLETNRVRGSGKRILTDIVSLVRFTLERDRELGHDGRVQWIPHHHCDRARCRRQQDDERGGDGHRVERDTAVVWLDRCGDADAREQCHGEGSGRLARRVRQER